MILKLIEQLGDKTLASVSKFYKALRFTLHVILHALNPYSYHSAMRMVLFKQIYFTAVQVLPMFILIALVFGSVIVGSVIALATEYGLQNEIGNILVYFIFNEFTPFFTALLIALRSGAAVNTEIAVMSVNNELNALKNYNIDLIDYLFLPRIISGMISVTALAALFAMIMLFSGYLFSLFYLQMELSNYLRILLNAIELENMLMLIFKSVIFGFFIMLLPIYSGYKTQKNYSAIPISVLNGMVNLFIALFLIEIGSILIWLM